MAVLKKQSLVDQIYEEIRKSIINLDILLGERLNVSELQEKFEVSSTPIREAINRLQKEGLVEYENNIGARTLAIHEKDVYEIQELAMTLHSAAVKFAMKKGDHQQMASEILGYIKKYEQAGDDIESRTQCVHDMIGVFYKNCGNSRLDANMGIIKGQQLILRNVYGRENGGTRQSADEFMELYQAVLDDNVQGVLDALQKNERRAMPIILGAINKYNKA